MHEINSAYDHRMPQYMHRISCASTKCTFVLFFVECCYTLREGHSVARRDCVEEWDDCAHADQEHPKYAQLVKGPEIPLAMAAKRFSFVAGTVVLFEQYGVGRCHVWKSFNRSSREWVTILAWERCPRIAQHWDSPTRWSNPNGSFRWLRPTPSHFVLQNDHVPTHNWSCIARQSVGIYGSFHQLGWGKSEIHPRR